MAKSALFSVMQLFSVERLGARFSAQNAICLIFAFLPAFYLQSQENYYPDSTFGQFGITVLPETKLQGANTVLLPDGKILVYAEKSLDSLNYHGTHYLARVNADGTLDAGFGSGGELIIPNELTYNFTAVSADVRPNGTILLGADGLGADTFGRISVTRCLPNGAVDPSFGVNGVCTIEDRSANQQFDLVLWSMLVSNNGKIFLGVGWNNFDATAPPYYQDRVYCVLPDGKVDSTFGTNGYHILTDTLVFHLESARLDAEDQIVTFANKNGNFGNTQVHIIKWDAQFNTISDINLNTLVPTQYPYLVASQSPVIQPDGKIIFIIKDYPNDLVGRLLPDGTLDPTFGKAGYFIHNFNQTGGTLRFLTPLDNGKLIGLINYDRVLTRLNKNGTVDLSLGLTGVNALPQPANAFSYYCFGLMHRMDGAMIKVDALDRRVNLSRFISKKCAE